MSSEAINTKTLSAGLNLGLFTIPQSAILLCGTVSALTLVLAEKATSEALIGIGQASEELFRGERLPILDFPTSTETEDQNPV
jgi:hypothetical protein